MATTKIDSIIGLEDVKRIWAEEKSFIPYPAVLHRYIQKVSKKEKWDLDIENLALDVASKIQKIDENTSLFLPHTFAINEILIKEYLIYQNNHSDVEQLNAMRFWGDFSNMGGLNMALTKSSEIFFSKDTSSEGVMRANFFIYIIAEVIQKKITSNNFIKIPILYREGGDEIGGYFIVYQKFTIEECEQLCSDINEEIEKISEKLLLNNIAHRKDPNNLERMGIGFICSCANVNWDNPEELQKVLEENVQWEKKRISKLRLSKHTEMIKKVSDEKLEILDRLFTNIIFEYDLASNEPKTIESLIIDNNQLAIIPATSRAIYLKKFFLTHKTSSYNRKLITTLFEIYNYAHRGICNVEDVNRCLLNASLSNIPVVCSVGQQTNFRGINEKFNHIFCDNFFVQVVQEFDSVLRKLKKKLFYDYAIFYFTAHNITTKNSVLIVYDEITQRSGVIVVLRNLIATFTKKLNLLLRKHDMEDIPDLSWPDRRGVKFIFAAREVPKNLELGDNIQVFKDTLKSQADENEDANVIFDESKYL